MKMFLSVVVALLTLFLADQTLLWLERRGWIYWRRRRAGIGAASTAGMMGELHTLFSPSHQHVSQEKERQLVLRDDVESGAPLDRRIDLNTGRVVVRRGILSSDRVGGENR